MRALITNGCVIDTEADPYPRARTETDVLIEDGVIVSVGPKLTAQAEDTEIIDATGHIVLPGFVDTHRHVWQSVLRAGAADMMLSEYLDVIRGRYGPAFRAEDVYAASLWGALEALNAGVTTMYDWSHIQLTPEHTDAAIKGLRESGVRAVFAYAQASPADSGRREDEVRRIRSQYFPSDVPGLVTPALAAWGPVYGSVQAAEADWRLARELGLRISLHATGEGPVERLHAAGLLGPDVLFVHGNGFSDESMNLIADSGGAMSVTPGVESQMGHGLPEGARARRFGIPTGLGVDTVTNVPGDMFSVMRATLIAERLRCVTEGTPSDRRPSAAEVLRMATIGGAEALGMADRIGSLRPGKQADIVLLDAGALNLAPLHDPITGVVTAADIGNVDTVLVGGRIVKRSGRLVHADVPRALDLANHSARHLATA